MFGQLGSRVADWLKYRETVRQLNFLDHHILNDIGFERTTIRDIKDRARTHTLKAHK